MSTPPRRPARSRRTTLIGVLAGALALGAAGLLIFGTAANATAPAPNAGGLGSAGPFSPAGTASALATAGVTIAPSRSASASASATASAASSVRSAVPLGPATLTVPAHRTAPGTVRLAWPNQGQAGIGIPGSTWFGSYGPVTTAQPIASVTKTMTAYQILHDHPLLAGQQGPSITITAADVAAYHYDIGQNMSAVPVRAGETLTENQALQALMLASADNIADVLAHWDTGTATDTAFVAKMNSRAAALGMTHTRYADASGYDPASVSTVPDQVALARSAMAVPYFAALVRQTSAVIPVAGTIRNYNSLLGTDGIDGIKTGSTGQAGGCLLFHARITVNGRTVAFVGAVLGQDAPTGQELGLGLAAAQSLIASAESLVTTRTVITAGTAVATLPMSDGTTATLRTTAALTVTAWPGESLTLAVAGSPTAPILQASTPDGMVLAAVPIR